MSDTERSTEALLKHQTRQAILDATDHISSVCNTDIISTGSKRRRFTESPLSNSDGLNSPGASSKPQFSGHNSSEQAKRFCPDAEPKNINEAQPWQTESVTHWLALDIITAGRQGSDLGRDQTPIVQFALALGHFSTKTVIDRLLINVHSESYIRHSTGVTDVTQSMVPAAAKQNETESHPVDQNVPVSQSNNPVIGDSLDEKTLTQKLKMFADGETSLNGFVSLTTESTELLARNAQSNIPIVTTGTFEAALDKIETWLITHGARIGTEGLTDCSLVVITDGHKALRNVLHPEAAYRGLDRGRLGRTPWSIYVDLLSWCKEVQFSSLWPKTKPVSNLSDAIEALQLSLDKCSGTGTALTKLDQMVAVIQHLVEADVPLSEPQIVRTVYEHRVFSRSISIKDGQVVEVRQVPWSATPSIIAGFFAGLNLLPGGVAIRLTDGRRSNTAIVAFECVLHAQLALVRHQHQLCGALLPESLNDSSNSQSDRPGTKDQSSSSTTSVSSATKPVMLQVYSATSREFIQCAGCEQQSVSEFLTQLTNGEQVVVRVRGLPYTVSKQQILDFFLAVKAPVLFDSQGIYLVAYPDRRPTGDAFVLFPDDKTATMALTRHKDYLGDRYVELFKASPSEMVQVCHNVSQQSHNSAKSQSSLFDLQTRARNTINTLGLPTLLPTLTPYLTKENQIALALKSLRPTCPITPLSNTSMTATGFLPTGMFSVGDLHPSLSETVNPDPSLDSVSIINNSLGINPSNLVQFGLHIPRSVSTLGNISTITPNLAALRTKPMMEPVIKDLTDPTDPDCPFARPLPEQGVSAMLQLSSLPLETSRHDVRLYLGPANFSKVYRMRCMEMTDNQASTSTWLLSLLDTNEAVHLIRDLVNRTFNLGTMSGIPSQVRVFPNVPTFTLYHVGPDKQLTLIPLDNPSLGIPFNRIHGLSGTIVQQNQQEQQQQQQQNKQQQQQQQFASTVQINSPIANTAFLARQDGTLQANMNQFPTPSQLFANGSVSVSTDSMYNQLLQALVSQSQFSNLKTTGCQPNTPVMTSISQTGSITPVTNPSSQVFAGSANPLLQLQPGALASFGDLTNSLVNTQVAASASTSIPSGSNSNACLVLITGAPIDATAEELTSLFQTVGHLLSAPPSRFTLFQSQPNGTAIFLALFATPLDAQTAALYCPSGILRNNQYTVGVACLVPSGASMDPFANVQYNSPASNLMFYSLPMMANSKNLL